jgi:putative membrane protein
VTGVQTCALPISNSAARLKESAVRQEKSVARQEDSADRRTILAANRTVLAAERTYAAWMRTGLAALASGIGARALLDGVVAGWMIGATGSVLILFSAFCFVAAIWRELRPDIAPEPETRRLPAPLLIAMNGFLMLVSLAALLGVWTAAS